MDHNFTNRPYPGLRPFQFEESDIFFGREEHTDQLLGKLGEIRFIAVVGLSGCGKSSLVRAGMIAALRSGYLAEAGTRWRTAGRTALMRPGEHPFANLAQALLTEAGLTKEYAAVFGQTDATEATLLPVVQTALQSGAFSLVELMRRAALPANTNLLICVDQFEELFRYHREGGQDEAEAFVKLLLTSAQQNDVPIYIVTTMRSEYIGECALFYGLPEVLNRGQFLVSRLTREQQEIAITGPAGVFGGTIEPDLVNRLLDEMGNDPDQLPLLQHCLMRMWTRQTVGISETSTVSLTLEDYEAVGGLKEALSKHADEAFNELNKQQQQIAETMFRCLTEGDRRRPATLNEIAKVVDVPETEVEEVTKVFRHPDRCFLTPSEDVPLKSDSMLDISHESLIRQWDILKKWVERELRSAEVYRNLEKDAILWEQEKHGLWRNPELEITLDWWKREKPSLEWASRYGKAFEIAKKFLEKSQQAQEEENLQKERQHEKELKRTRQLLAWTLSGLIVIFSLAVLAFWEWSISVKAKKELERTLRIVKEAQEKAELNSTSFRALVNATFGFLAKSGKNKDFLIWTEKTSTINKLIPALHLLIDLSESMDEKQKKFWHDALSTMKESEKSSLLDILGIEEATNKKARVPESFFLREGIPLKSPRDEEFISWVKEKTWTEDLNSLLSHMIDLSELDKETKKHLQSTLPDLTEEQKEELLYSLWIESEEKNKE